MSSACVCHTGEWCFYCEMYVPLERRERQLLIEFRGLMQTVNKEAHLLVAESLRTNKLIPVSINRGKVEAYRFVIDRITEVIDRYEDSHTRHSTQPERNDQRVQKKQVRLCENEGRSDQFSSMGG